MSLNIYKAAFEEILHAFHTLTMLKIVVLDANANEIMEYPEENGAICTELRKTERGCSVCARSERDFCKKCADLRGLYVSKCPAGLTEAAIPIMKDGIIIGYIMFGQTCDKNLRHTLKGSLEKVLSECGREPDRELINRLLSKVKYKTADEIHAAAVLLKAFSKYVQMNNLAVIDDSDMISEIVSYISENLDRDLSTKALCARFFVSRSKLYAMTEAYMKGGISAYVKNARLTEASRLLSKTELPVRKVSAAVGLSDYAYFNRCFKEKFGICASEYRKASKLNSQQAD